MGDIDDRNFNEEIIEQFKTAIAASCTFVSIDLEMSGISFPNKRTETGGDSVPYRYKNIREVAATFGIIQIGITIFNENNAAQVFNFHVFPRPVTDGDSISSIPNITLCSASTNFNRSNGLDFKRWIDHGITYVNKDIEEKLFSVLLDKDADVQNDEVWSRFLSGFSIDGSITSSVEYKGQEDRVLGEIDEFLKNENLSIYRMPFIHGGQRWMKSILSTIHAKYPSSIRLMEEVSGGGTRRFLTKKNPTEIFNDYLGFRRIWKILTESQKPLVVHNGFLDLMFCYQAFENDLPETVGEFKTSLSKLFSAGIFDTRLIAIESGIASGGAALETLVESLVSRQASTVTPVVTVNSGQYNETGSVQFHDAGYDALLTGKVFKALSAQADIMKWKNMVCMARCLWVLTIDSVDSDKVLIDCGVGKTRIIRYLTDISGSTRDVLNTFDELKQVVNGLMVNIQWIDDTSGLLLLSYTQPGDKSHDAVVGALNSKMLDIIKCNGPTGSGAKLWSIPDFIKRQLESFDSPKRFRV